ncbi:MAG: GntR family transcriptional regulator [Burkholderiales bacterium]|nr:GntR family transcriptional regulator [Burkholderiales bacterium]
MKTEQPVSGFQPLYRRIKAQLTERLSAGEWRPGEPIPSEIDLAQRFRVSQGTVRKAVGELAGENVLVRKQGRGTFVASHAHTRSQLSFLRLTPDDGSVEELEAALVDVRRVRADATSARMLALTTGASLVRLRRTLSINGNRILFEEARVPADLFQGLGPEVVERHRCMLYSMYESAYHVKIVAAEERLKAVDAEADIAAFLDVAPGTPLLLMERVAYTYDRKPVELRRGYCNTSRHHYANEIT